jgi:hypothetical protein
MTQQWLGSMRMTPMRWRYMARKFWNAAKVMRKWPDWEETALAMAKNAEECAKRGRGEALNAREGEG